MEIQNNSIYQSIREIIALSRLDTLQKREYYIQESIQNNLNSRQLQRAINTLSFERVVIHPTDITETYTIHSIIKDPNVFDFLGLSINPKNSEQNIETAIINHLLAFLLEFGKGFAFVAR